MTRIFDTAKKGSSLSSANIPDYICELNLISVVPEPCRLLLSFPSTCAVWRWRVQDPPRSSCPSTSPVLRPLVLHQCMTAFGTFGSDLRGTGGLTTFLSETSLRGVHTSNERYRSNLFKEQNVRSIPERSNEEEANVQLVPTIACFETSSLFSNQQTSNGSRINCLFALSATSKRETSNEQTSQKNKFTITTCEKIMCWATSRPGPNFSGSLFHFSASIKGMWTSFRVLLLVREGTGRSMRAYVEPANAFGVCWWQFPQRQHQDACSLYGAREIDARRIRFGVWV